MKTQQDIERELIENFVSINNNITFFGIGGVLRGIFTSVSMKMRELWYDLTSLKRKLFINTCFNTDLDDYGAERNIARLSGRKAGTMITFTGAKDTLVPKGSIITNPTTNIQYTTMQDLTIGTKNPNLQIPNNYALSNIMIGDSCWAECITEGIVGNSAPNTITKCNITGIDNATNSIPAQGGLDTEDDDSYRYRIKNYTKLLNNDTSSFYETLTLNVDDRIMRAFAYKDYSKPDAIIILVVPKSGVGLDATTLNSIAQNIQNNQRSFTNITCKNIEFTAIYVDMKVKLNSGITLENYFINVVDVLSKYFDWSKWEWGQAIQRDNVAKQVLNIASTKELDLVTFKINNLISSNIPLLSKLSLPYFSGLKITDLENPATPISNYSIVESYENYLIYQSINQKEFKCLQT